MNENINLCELLKGHEGEIFYYAVKDSYVILDKILNDCYICVEDKESPNLLGCLHNTKSSFILYSDGSFCKNGFCVLFPSKDQRDWYKWAEEQKTPKTFDKIPLAERDYFIRNIPNFELNKIQKAALALLKIHQLIEAGYGGNITNEEWDNEEIPKHTIKAHGNNIVPCEIYIVKSHIAFHTKEQRNEFLSYSENVQLLKDFYMI